MVCNLKLTFILDLHIFPALIFIRGGIIIQMTFMVGDIDQRTTTVIIHFMEIDHSTIFSKIWNSDNLSLMTLVLFFVQNV